jgi:hypothetical protein
MIYFNNHDYTGVALKDDLQLAGLARRAQIVAPVGYGRQLLLLMRVNGLLAREHKGNPFKRYHRDNKTMRDKDT